MLWICGLDTYLGTGPISTLSNPKVFSLRLIPGEYRSARTFTRVSSLPKEFPRAPSLHPQIMPPHAAEMDSPFDKTRRRDSGKSHNDTV